MLENMGREEVVWEGRMQGYCYSVVGQGREE